MKWHYPIRILREENNGVVDPAAEGLSARLEAFLAGSPEPVIGGDPPVQPDPPAEPPAPPAAPDPIAPDPNAPDPNAPDPDDDPDDDEDELPQLGQKPKATEPAPGSDEDFDAQTERIVKAIEAAGHPGDEYKRLRAELKAAKAKPAIADLDAVPEVQELRQKAARAEQLETEAEALRQRNRELLQVNNEVEVRESDAFIQQVREPMAQMETLVTQIATAAEIDPQTLFAVIAETDITKQDRMLEQLHQKLGSRTTGRIERFCDDYKQIQAKGAAMLADAGKNAEKARLAREQAAQAEQRQRVELFKSSVEQSFTAYAKRVPGFVDSSGNLTDLAKATMAKTAEVDLAQLGPDDLGYMAFAANVLPDMRKALVALNKEIALLKGGKTKPKALDGKPAPTKPVDDEKEPQGLSERMKGMEFTFTPPR